MIAGTSGDFRVWPIAEMALMSAVGSAADGERVGLQHVATHEGRHAAPLSPILTSPRASWSRSRTAWRRCRTGASILVV